MSPVAKSEVTLIVLKWRWSSFNQAVCELRFLFRTTYSRRGAVSMVPPCGRPAFSKPSHPTRRDIRMPPDFRKRDSIWLNLSSIPDKSHLAFCHEETQKGHTQPNHRFSVICRGNIKLSPASSMFFQRKPRMDISEHG